MSNKAGSRPDDPGRFNGYSRCLGDRKGQPCAVAAAVAAEVSGEVGRSVYDISAVPGDEICVVVIVACSWVLLTTGRQCRSVP
jgi:hypothetical protein